MCLIHPPTGSISCFSRPPLLVLHRICSRPGLIPSYYVLEPGGLWHAEDVEGRFWTHTGTDGLEAMCSIRKTSTIPGY